MAKRSGRSARWDGHREAHAIAGNLGRDLRATRRRRRLTQAQLGDRVGLSQTQISAFEAGEGATTSLETWIAIGIALGRPVAIGFSRDVVAPLSDAGHLAAQELVTRLATGAGWRVAFERPDDPRAPAGSTDLALERDDAIALVEIWNRIDDLGAGVRSSDRKRATDARGARSVWLFVDTAANRAIARRFPAILRARFPGSSLGWVAALTGPQAPPERPGLAWIDLRAARLRPMRLGPSGLDRRHAAVVT